MKSGFTPEELKTKTPDQVIDASRELIFDFSYPIYDAEHKPELEKKILKHYYTREIGTETVALWKLQLNSTLNDIMPKYNKLYSAEFKALNKELMNIDVTKDHERTDNLLKTSDYTRIDNLAHGDTTRDRYSDTPQGTITNVDNDSYLTEYRNVTNSGTNTGTQRNAGTEANTGTQDIDETEVGYRGEKIYAMLLSDYADKVLNIDLMIINELQDLFMKLW